MVITWPADAIREANANAQEAHDFGGSEQQTRLGKGKSGIERGSDISMPRSLLGKKKKKRENKAGYTTLPL